MRVPFVDLKAQYMSLKAEFDAAILRVLSETAFVAGRYAAAFEREFADYLGVKHCIGVANGTDAIEIALLSVGIRSGDEVLVPANTFFATAEAVVNIGAVPVFVDIDAATYNIDPDRIEAPITPLTKAIIPVHLYGLPAEMEPIVQVARKHGLKIVEDCAQAHGATYNGQKVGTFGDAATFSFYPSKNLGAFGDGGAIVTNGDDVEALARAISNHGQLTKNKHSMIGRNSRLDGLQGAILSVKLPHLDGWIEARRSRAAGRNAVLDSHRWERPAPAWTLPDLDGKSHQLADFAGKVVVLDFWGTWCGPCRQELPIYQKMFERYRDKGVVFYGVNWERTMPGQDPKPAVRDYLTKNGLTFPVVLDHERTAQTAYDIEAFPTVFLIDKTGKIRFRNVGVEPNIEHVLADQIESLLD